VVQLAKLVGVSNIYWPVSIISLIVSWYILNLPFSWFFMFWTIVICITLIFSFSYQSQYRSKNNDEYESLEYQSSNKIVDFIIESFILFTALSLIFFVFVFKSFSIIPFCYIYIFSGIQYRIPVAGAYLSYSYTSGSGSRK
jgi:hypothetical protein